MSKDHSFTKEIENILESSFKDDGKLIFNTSPLLQYLNKKTISANSSSKARGSFANLYAIYVLIEDYITIINEGLEYKYYSGALYSKLVDKMRALPFGKKLQNHSLNSRANEEFKKFFSELNMVPIIRDLINSKYWINENLLIVTIKDKTYNIAQSILSIIEKYIDVKKSSFDIFIEDCKKIQEYNKSDKKETAHAFILDLINPNRDARIFEIVSYSILKYTYFEEIIFIGNSIENVEEKKLILYKTGRTNANDGGIDFVMKPLGRFFQVTESLDVKKYFLDIDKIEHFPVTFVIKTSKTREEVLILLKNGATEQYSITTIIERYMNSIEEIITINELSTYLNTILNKNLLDDVINEIITWSKIEFNYVDDDDTVVDGDDE